MSSVWFLALLSVLMGIVSMVASAGQEPFWYQIANMVVMVSAVVLGGYLRVRQVRKARGPGGLGTTA
jgi:NhaP-type Na+/H+ and K+/H+ antiporter